MTKAYPKAPADSLKGLPRANLSLKINTASEPL